MRRNHGPKIFCECPKYKKTYLAEVIGYSVKAIAGQLPYKEQAVICPACGDYHYVEVSHD